MNHVKRFKKCKNYWWCFKKAVKEYYRGAIEDPEEREEVIDNLLSYAMWLGKFTRAYVDGQEVKEFGPWKRTHCTLKEFLTEFNRKEIVVKAEDFQVEIGIYPPQDKDGEYQFDILDHHNPHPLTEENAELWKEELKDVDAQPM